MKKVRIACFGANTAALDEFNPLQGELKVLEEEQYQQLKKLIVDHGFSDPINAWERDNQLFIVSGHQRVATLKRMRGEGFEVPYLPYSLVEAENEHEAKMKVLGAASQFGKITVQGLRALADELELDVHDIDSRFHLPGVDLPALQAVESSVDVAAHVRQLGGVGEDPSNTTEYKTNAERIDQYLGSEVRRLSLVMGPADYDRLTAGLQMICDSANLDTHGAAVLFLLDEFNAGTKDAPAGEATRVIRRSNKDAAD